MIPHGSDIPCQICREAAAEIIDSEQGAICFACHDSLDDIDQVLGRVSLTILRNQPTNDLP